MSATLYRYGSIEPPASTALANTSATAIATASDKYLKVVETISIANSDNSNTCRCTIRWVDAAATATIIYNKLIAAGDTVLIDNIPLLLDGKGTVRSLTAQADTGGRLVVSVLTSMQSKQNVSG